jgi:hypothetical protein
MLHPVMQAGNNSMNDSCNCSCCPHNCGGNDDPEDSIENVLDNKEEKANIAHKKVTKLKSDIKKLGFKVKDTKDGLRVSR